MLRKRTATVTSNKQALMADIISIPCPAEKFKKPTSFPRLFTGFNFKNFTESTESVMSPTSILDSKPFSNLKKPFFSDPTPTPTPIAIPTPTPTPRTPDFDSRRTWNRLGSKGIVDALNDDDNLDTKLSKPEGRMVLFGSQLKIQVPPLPPLFVSPEDSPKSPADFGIKTRSSFASGLSHSPVKNSGMDIPNSPRFFTGCLSATEMELSEDYTCVISYGPNLKTTHIYHDCIIESCCGVVEFSASRTGFLTDGSSYPPENFLSFCYACKKNLGQGKDIYMYRGEKAFCSKECRYQEMVIDKMDPEDVYGTCS